MGEDRKARQRIEARVGESVRIVRQLQELSQNQLADLTGIPQSTISAIETGKVKLGVERAKVLARALKVHPAVAVRLRPTNRRLSWWFLASIPPSSVTARVPFAKSRRRAR